MRIPSRGEIWFANLNPTAGREQQGSRPVLVVSEKEFNRLGLCIVCPVTQGGQQSRYAGFAVTLMGTGTETQGVVMCNQPRTIDLAARGGRFVEAVGSDFLEEVLARLQPIFDSGS
ncbi:MAG: type II toxin-antitoxin system PemK/MazF family toxin [Polaromonas sp.]|nr:type II toxin-antitoxin system PemK/MazF family toxin [Polaromonas sp.]